jgi:hypothetical protein
MSRFAEPGRRPVAGPQGFDQVASLFRSGCRITGDEPFVSLDYGSHVITMNEIVNIAPDQIFAGISGAARDGRAGLAIWPSRGFHI